MVLLDVFIESSLSDKCLFACGALEAPFSPLHLLALALRIQVAPVPRPRLEAPATLLAGVLLQTQVNIVHVVPQGGLLPELLAALAADVLLGPSLPGLFRLVVVVVGLVAIETRPIRKVLGAEAADKLPVALVGVRHVVGQLGLEQVWSLSSPKVSCQVFRKN